MTPSLIANITGGAETPLINRGGSLMDVIKAEIIIFHVKNPIQERLGPRKEFLILEA